MTTSETLSGGPEHEPWSSRQRAALGVGLAALMTVAGGAAYQYNRSQKFPMPEEQHAQESIQKVFATMDASDIMQCAPSGPPVASATVLPFIGPTNGERAHVPAISVNVIMKPGELDASKEMQSSIGRYSAGIVWHSLQLESQIRFIPSSNKSNTIHKQSPSEHHSATVYDYIFPFEHSENLRLNMPVHPPKNSTAIIDIVPVVGAVILTETNQSEPETAPVTIERKLIGDVCVSLSASIRGGRVREVTVFEGE